MDSINYEYIGRILENIHPSITIVDKNGIFVFVSKSCNDYFGVEADQILGKRIDNPEIEDIFKPCVSEMVYKKKEKIVTIQKNFNGTDNLVTGIPLFSEDGKLEMILCFSSWEVSSYEDLKNNYNLLKTENEVLLNQLNRLSRDEYMNSNLISRSRKFQDTERLLKIFSDAGLPAFLYGPHGCGKKYLAKVTYSNTNLLYEYNCDLLNEDIIERELFSDQGLLSCGNDKMLLIHNIDCLTPRLQQKLIQLLKHNGIVVVGISEYSLEQLRENNLIIDDFYYYFISYQVQITPLNQRLEDLNAFINHYLNYYNTKYERSIHFTPRAVNTLLNYAWPENINEVKYTMERIVLTAEHDKVDIYQLPKQISQQSIDAFTDNASLKDMMEFFEKGIITRAYEKYRTTVAVAENLGISQASATRKIKKYVNKENPD